MNEKEEVKRFIKKAIEDRRNHKYQIFLPAEYEDERTIEFTQAEADDLMGELENKPDRKFSISLPPEYVEILDDMAKRDTKRWKLAKFTRNLIIKDAIEKYILDRGYIVTRKLLNFHEVAELEPLMALCKKAEKLRDFPAWARGYWRRHNLLTASHGEYIGNDSDDVVDKWFLDIFKEMRKERKTK